MIKSVRCGIRYKRRHDVSKKYGWILVSFLPFFWTKWNLGPISIVILLRWKIHSTLTQIRQMAALKLCTWQDSTAVVTCAKFCTIMIWRYIKNRKQFPANLKYGETRRNSTQSVGASPPPPPPDIYYHTFPDNAQKRQIWPVSVKGAP